MYIPIDFQFILNTSEVIKALCVPFCQSFPTFLVFNWHMSHIIITNCDSVALIEIIDDLWKEISTWSSSLLSPTGIFKYVQHLNTMVWHSSNHRIIIIILTWTFIEMYIEMFISDRCNVRCWRGHITCWLLLRVNLTEIWKTVSITKRYKIYRYAYCHYTYCVCLCHYTYCMYMYINCQAYWYTSNGWTTGII